MKLKIPHIILISLFILYSCTEKFYPEIESDVSILVVDGKITNQPGPYEVRLFRTVALNEADTLSPEQGATIVIYDDKGGSEVFGETLPGVYKTQNPSFQGQIGNSYWIEIQTISGDRYESTPETIQPEIMINSIYADEGDVLLEDASTIKAAQILIDAQDPTNQSSYLRWEYQESWEWRNPYYEPKTANPSKICYPYQSSNNVFIFDGSGQDQKSFNQLTSSIIRENEVKLNYEYYINLSMYSVNFENYNFWKNIKESIQQNGGLYNVIPANTTGNVCACDSKTPVLGYFEASSVNTKTASFSTANFEMEFIDFPQDCNDIEMRFRDGRPDESIFHIVDDYIEGEAHVFIVRQNYCYDCNFKYSPNKPSFWP